MAKRASSKTAKNARKSARPSAPAPRAPLRQPPRAGREAPPAPPGPPVEALALFQRGMELLQKHQFVEAARAFQGVLMGFPAEKALGDRARVYLELCERESSRRPAPPRTVEERLATATAALNNGDDPQAEDLVRSVLGDEPKNDIALYLLAALRARSGDPSEALDLLRKAIELGPEASAQAREDDDFDNLKDIQEFWDLTEQHSSPAHRPPRKGPA